MLLAEAPADEAQLCHAERKPPREPRPGCEQEHVGDGDDRDQADADRGGEAARDDRERHREEPETDERLELERLVLRPHPGRDDRAEANHCGDVEGVGADHDPDRHCPLVLDERRDGRGQLRRVGREGGEQPEQRLRHAEPQANVVEPAREHRGRGKHQRDRSDEEGGGEGRRHRLTPTSLPGTPSRTLTGEARGCCAPARWVKA